MSPPLNHIDLADQSRARQIDPMADKPRVNYQIGYGDFCFGRLVDQIVIGQTRPIFVEKATSMDHIRVASAFTRKGSFEFFKLPLEVRRIIYRIIFHSLYLEDMETIFFRIIPVRPSPHLWHFRGNYPWYLRNFEHTRPRPSLDIFSRKAETNTEKMIDVNPLTLQEYNAEKKRLTDQDQTHPTRQTPYRLEIQGRASGFSLVKENSANLYVEWIRQLSNVCNQMRKEIGDFVWSRTYISSPDPSGMWLFQNMLVERPLIHNSVNRLDLKLVLDQSQNIRRYLGDFKKCCKYMAKRLQLESLTFTLELAEEDLHPYNVTAAGYFAALSACREMRVEKEFDVQIFVTKWTLSAPFNNTRAMDKRQKAQRSFYMPRFKELMMPDSLRVVTAVEEKVMVDEVVEEAVADEQVVTDSSASSHDTEDS